MTPPRTGVDVNVLLDCRHQSHAWRDGAHDLAIHAANLHFASSNVLIVVGSNMLEGQIRHAAEVLAWQY